MSDGLLPCPFCGSAAETWKHHIESSGDSCPVFHVGCRNDACAVKPAVHIAGQWGYPNKGDLTNEQANAKAVEDWNRRNTFITARG